MRCWRSVAPKFLGFAVSEAGQLLPIARPLANSKLVLRGSSTTTPTPTSSLSSHPLHEEMRTKGFVNSTPNFSCDFSEPSPSFPTEFETTVATNVDFVNDIHGPWLVMTDDLQGELFVDHDAFVYYRPANGIGYGVGKMELLGAESSLGTAFTCTLMVYTYQQTEMFAPLHGITLHITGMVNKVSAKSSQPYTTFSLVGIWQKNDPNMNPEKVGNLLNCNSVNHGGAADELQEPVAANESDMQVASPASSSTSPDNEKRARTTGKFSAAKLSPWVPTPKDTPWQPNEELQSMLKQVFPQDLKLTSHLRRAAESEEAHACASSIGMEEEDLPEMLQQKLLHHVDLSKYKVGGIPHVYYIPDYISESEEAQILEFIKNTPNELKSTLKKRVAQEWGCTMCNVCNKSFVSDANMPNWVQQCTDMLVYDGIFTPSTFPNSVRIHEYQKGEGIGPHCDGPIYVPMVTVLSLASTSVMGFYPRTDPYSDQPMEHYNDTFKFDEGPIGKQRRLQTAVMEPRSLLIFCGAAYYYYPHGVSDAEVDDLSPEVAGEVVNRHLLREKDIMQVPRSYRVSITTRNLLTRCNDQPKRAEYNMKRAWYLYHHLPLPTPLFTTSPLALQADAGSVATSDSGSSAASFVSSPRTSSGPLSSELLERWEQKMDRIFSQQTVLSEEVKELKRLLAESVAAGSSFQKETSGVLNSVTKSLLEVDSKLEDLMDELRTPK